MHKFSKLTNGCADNALGGPGRMMGWAGVLGGILFFALLFNPIQAFSATVPAGQSITLNWNASTGINVVGYNIYCGGASRDYTNMINAGNVTNFTISSLTAGVTYYFAVTAYDGFGQESAYSSEISYLVPPPAPALQIRSAPAGQFILTVSGLTGQTYDVLATQDFTAWTIIGTVTLGAGGSLDFTDTNAASFPQRFYRAVVMTNVVATLQIHSAPGGQIILTVTGSVGQSYDVLATQDFTAWTIIGTVTLGTGGSLDFSDTNAASFPQRFYCTRAKP